nr:MAG TPA: hypothetical protein [Bacteriophage sp.]
MVSHWIFLTYLDTFFLQGLMFRSLLLILMLGNYFLL